MEPPLSARQATRCSHLAFALAVPIEGISNFRPVRRETARLN